MRKSELASLILCGLYIHFNLVSDFEIWIVTELRSRDDTLALISDINQNFSLCDGGNCTFNDFVLNDFRESLIIHLLDLLLVCTVIGFILECIPIELVGIY